MKTGDPKTVWRAALLSLGSEPQARGGFGYSDTAEAYHRSGHAEWVRNTKQFFVDAGLTEGWHSQVTNYCIWLKEQEALPDGQRSDVRVDTT